MPAHSNDNLLSSSCRICKYISCYLFPSCRYRGYFLLPLSFMSILRIFSTLCSTSFMTNLVSCYLFSLLHAGNSQDIYCRLICLLYVKLQYKFLVLPPPPFIANLKIQHFLLLVLSPSCRETLGYLQPLIFNAACLLHAKLDVSCPPSSLLYGEYEDKIHATCSPLSCRF